MAPREIENNAYAKFWGDKQRTLWYVMVFSGGVNTTTWSCYVNFSGCGHCKAMKPAYMDAAQELANKNVNTSFRPI